MPKFLGPIDYTPTLSNGTASDKLIMQDATSPNTLLGVTIGTGLSVSSGVLTATGTTYTFTNGLTESSGTVK